MKDRQRLYAHAGVALLRSAAWPVAGDRGWPDLPDVRECREWLCEVWAEPDVADALRCASPTLATRLDTIVAGRPADARAIRKTVLSTAGYLLRGAGRPTPFGLFAGVAPVTIGKPALGQHKGAGQPVVRVDTGWLAAVVERVESDPLLLPELRLVVSNLVTVRGKRVEVPNGHNRVTVRHSQAVAAALARAAAPVTAGALIESLTTEFDTTPPGVTAMVSMLVRQGFLITELRAPFTVVDPLGHLCTRLRAPASAGLRKELQAIRERIVALNRDGHDQRTERDNLRASMVSVAPGVQRQLATDLRFDAEVQVPAPVVRDLERAASVLLRMTRYPRGTPVWHDYRTAFTDRYGTATLVPLREALDRDAGLGYPAGYPGSVLRVPPAAPADRDAALLRLAWSATCDGTGEIDLSDADVDGVAAAGFDPARIPPHVEMTARVHARSTEALDRGEYTIIVAPARAAGTLTSRFTPVASGSGLAELYRRLPPATEGALRAQLSFGAQYVHAENIVRVPRYLDHVLPLGEYHCDHSGQISVDDLALTATNDAMYLVSLSRRQIVEPQVFHALALEKQPAPLARFLAHLPRAFSASWHQFDWGPHAELPRLPRVRYGRTVLAPAQWRITGDDLRSSGGRRWGWLLARWRERWACPDVVELRDGDRGLRLSLTSTVHQELLRTHLVKHGHAVLVETARSEDYDWLGGYVHEIAVPLVTRGIPAPNPIHVARSSMPLVRNADRVPPAGPGARWLSVKVFTHPERMTEVVTEHLPSLLGHLTEPAAWWLRYRDGRDMDHLRIRLRRNAAPHRGVDPELVAGWAAELQRSGVISGLEFDTYLPETGRYGGPQAIAAAERVFITDSEFAALALRAVESGQVDPLVITVAGTAGLVAAYWQDAGRAQRWLIEQPSPGIDSTTRVTRDAAVQVAGLDTVPPTLAGASWWNDDLAAAWERRLAAMLAYRRSLAVTDEETVSGPLESLLHLHHNRLLGINPDSERTCRTLLRHVALSARHRAGTR